MRITATEEGIRYLNALADGLLDAVEEIKRATQSVLSAAESDAALLGPHADQLREALESIGSETEAVSDDALVVAEKLRDVADAYDDIVSTDRFTGKNETSAVGAGAVYGGSAAGGQTKTRLEELIRTVNPHYGNPFFPQSSVNCGACAYAVEQRLSGNTGATASLTNIGKDRGMEAATGKKCIYMEPEDIAQRLVDMGPGAHCVAGINRRHPVTGQSLNGHWFNLYYDGENIYTLDGQSGEVFEFPHDYGYVSEWCALF